MYQCQETQTKRKEGDQEITEYHYSHGWFETQINSDNFDNQDMRVNPSNAWPFKSETLTAQNVMVGKFRLNSTQITRLGMQQEQV